MNNKQYLKYHELFTEKMIVITKQKNHDYAGHGNDNPFANFEMIERLGFDSTEKGLLIRMFDKMSRLMTFIEKGELAVAGESVHDACLDLANYAAILSAIANTKESDTSAKEIIAVPYNDPLSSIDPSVLPIKETH